MVVQKSAGSHVEAILERGCSRRTKNRVTTSSKTTLKTANKKTFTVSSFNPLKEDSLLDTADNLGFDIVPFAIGDCSDPIFLRPGAGEPETVYIAFHDDPGQVEVLAELVAGLIERLRSEKPQSATSPDPEGHG